MAALDCEMVTTVNGMELGRVSVVNSEMEVLFDSFVSPCNPVMDYNTRYSGLTEEAMRDAPSLTEVRAKFLQIVQANTVLVGHSLDNDLRCLRVVHRRVADTSLLYPHTRGPPYKRSLRDLASTYLQLSIQEGEHCPVTDASVAMKLLQLKMSRGLSFAVPTKEFHSLWESVRDKSGAMIMTTDMAEPLRGVYGEGVGNARVMTEAKTAEEVLTQMGEESGSLIYGLLPDAFERDRILQTLETMRTLLFDRLPRGTLLVVHGGRGSLSRLLELQEQRGLPDAKTAELDTQIATEAMRIRTVPIWMQVK